MEILVVKSSDLRRWLAAIVTGRAATAFADKFVEGLGIREAHPFRHHPDGEGAVAQQAGGYLEAAALQFLLGGVTVFLLEEPVQMAGRYTAAAGEIGDTHGLVQVIAQQAEGNVQGTGSPCGRRRSLQTEFVEQMPQGHLCGEGLALPLPPDPFHLLQQKGAFPVFTAPAHLKLLIRKGVGEMYYIVTGLWRKAPFCAEIGRHQTPGVRMQGDFASIPS